MKTKKRILPALILSLFASFASVESQAQQFSNVYVFGDSLSDAGYYRAFLAALGLPPSLVAQMGRFSTNPGPVWSELIAQHYGVTPAPSNAGGTIYAQGGARIALSPGASTPPGFPERPISTQITEYLSTHGNAADPDALYAVWGGANDLFVQQALLEAGTITAAQFQANILAAATAEVQQVARLFQAGARFVVVIGGFDPAFTPALAAADPATRAGITQLAVGFNSTLFGGLAGAGIRVIPVDLFSLVNEIRANPAAFGFTNVTGVACGPFPPITTSARALFCHTTNLVSGDAAERFFFADPTGHMTTAANRIIAQFAQAVIEGPFLYSVLAEVPLRTRAAHVAAVNDGLAGGHAAEAGKLTAFVSGGGGNFDIDPAPGVAGLDSSNRHVTAGVTMRASDSVVLGLAVGKGRSDASFGRDAGGFRTDEVAWSAFVSARWNGLYASGVVSIADLEFDEMHRNVQLGALTRTMTARAEGSNASAFINAGYDFPIGRFMVGPTVAVTLQNVEVDAFEESGGGSSNLKIFDQKRRSEVWSVGVRASADFGGWTPWVRVTADKERKDDERLVTAMPLSLAATGNVYDIPAYRGDTKFVTVSAGLRGWITRNIGLGISYSKVTSRSGLDEDAASAILSVKF